MNMLPIRDAIVEFTESAFRTMHPDVPIVFNNGPFNWNSPPELSMHVEVEFNHGHRISLGGSLKTRILGMVYATARTAPQKGHRVCLNLLTPITVGLSEIALSAPGYRIVTQAVIPAGVSDVPGLYGEAVKVAFHADPI